MIGLKITLPDGSEREVKFDDSSILIGRGATAKLRIKHSSISDVHTALKTDSTGRTQVVDLGGERGTLLNGQPVVEPTYLKLGDRIEIGALKLDVVILGAETLQASILSKAATKNPPPPIPELADSSIQLERTRMENRQAIQNTDENSDIEPRFLRVPLDERQQPTEGEHALEIAVFWGDDCLDTLQVHKAGPITIGGRVGKATDLVVEASLPADQFTLAINQGTQATIVVPADAKVGVRKKDGSIDRNVRLEATDAPFPARAFQLGMGERLVFKAGTLTFVCQFVRGNAQLAAGSVMDWYFPRVFSISALLHVFFVIAALITPDLQNNLADDMFKNQSGFIEAMLKAPEKEKKQDKLDLSGMKDAGRHKGEEGKFGKKDKPERDALASKAGAPRVDPNKREKDRKIAFNSGLLGILKGGGGAGAVSNVFGPGGLGTGINNAMGGLRGTGMGDAGGAGGLGSRGTGAGGGGNALGIGGLGAGTGRGGGGYGNIDLGGRGKGRTRIVPGRTIIQGALSKEEIGRVIRQNLPRFKHCYEKELNRNPNLGGKIAIYFVIAPTGSVAQASVRETSMNDSAVESCAAKVMESLRFPRPKGGGVVVVTYPFMFAAT